jgi:hypothetical protein
MHAETMRMLNAKHCCEQLSISLLRILRPLPGHDLDPPKGNVGLVGAALPPGNPRPPSAAWTNERR